jgi:Fur family ferric uptake transcriptional regulator
MTSHPQATERFKNYLSIQNLRWTAQRDGLLDAFLKHPGHVSADELHRQTTAGQRMGFATVYRNLKHLVACGLAREVDMGDSCLYFEKTLENEHHDHLICDHCGSVVEFLNPQIERLQEKVALQYGYEITRHRLLLYGVCQNCQVKNHKNKAKKLFGRTNKSIPKTSVGGHRYAKN